jgi:two-component system chemotaxis sensor kinase CheA
MTIYSDDRLLFQESARRRVDSLHECIDCLDYALRAGKSSADTINAVFRDVHSLKGSAGFAGYADLEGFAHVLENLLGFMRTGSVSLSEKEISVLSASTGIISCLLDGCDPGEIRDYENILHRLKSYSAGKDSQLLRIHLFHSRRTWDISKVIFKDSIQKKGKNLNFYLICFDMQDDMQMQQLLPTTLIEELLSVGTILHSELDSDNLGDLDSFGYGLYFHVLCASQVNYAVFRRLFRLREDMIQKLNITYEEVA